MEIRRLSPDTDEMLLREAFAWTATCPRWHREMDAVFGPPDVDDFIKSTCEPMNVFVGIFNPEFVGMIIIAYASKGIFNSHLCAQRGASLEVLAQAAERVVIDFLNMGMVEGFCYVAEKNTAIRKLCSTIGFQHEGVVMYKGSYRGRVIKWLKYSVRPQVQQSEVAA